MSDQEFSHPPAEVVEYKEITKRPEYGQACENTRQGGDLISELIKLGVPRAEVETFALASLEKNIRAGYGLATIRSIVRQGGVIAETDVDRLFEEVKTKMLTDAPAETAEEIALREARELEEMLKLYE